MKLTFHHQAIVLLGAGLALLLLVGTGAYMAAGTVLDNAGAWSEESLRIQAQRGVQTVKLLLLAGGLPALGLLAWVIFMLGRGQAQRQRVPTDSEAVSRAVAESIAEGVITVTADGLIVNTNAAALKLFGYESAELLGRPLTQLMPASSRGPFAEFFSSVVAQPEGFAVSRRKGRGLLKNGEEIVLEVSYSSVTVQGRRLFTTVVHDITEAKRTSDALRASESQLREITDTVPALIVYVDMQQRVQFHNKAYEESLGLSHDQIQGKTLHEVLGDELYEAVHARVNDALAGYSVRYERSQLNANGDLRDYDIKYFPRYGEGEQEGEVIGFYALGNDITDLKRIDRMKTEFVSTVSHELRTPLTSIRGSLGLIMGGVAGELSDKAKNLVGIARDNCERLIRLINDILDSEKIESGKMRFDFKVTNLAPLLEQAIAANEGFAAQHQVILDLDTSGGALYADVDSDRFAQVVTNLLSNAVKFSAPQGWVRIRLLKVGERVRVEVSDCGPGIPEEFRKRIFQKFSQADSSDTRQKGGTGLGLSISRAIVERMGGQIGFTTELDVGTTFFFELPERHPPKPIVMGLDPDAPGYTAPRPRILVCESDPEVARLTLALLDKGGFDPERVDSGAQALELLTIQSFAAMTIDVRLPGGVALIRSLQGEKHTRHLPIVMVAAVVEGGRLKFNNQPFMVSGWLQRPIDDNRLILGLRRAIAGIAGDKPRILHVEDDQDIQRITSAISQDFATFVFASTLEEARGHLRSNLVDVVLLDLNLGPGQAPGTELFEDIRRLNPSPPVVVFAASDLSDAEREHATAILIKTKTSDEELRATLVRVLADTASVRGEV